MLAAVIGWCTAVLTGAIAFAISRGAATRAESLGSACHELRGPIAAIGLGIALCARTGTLPPERLRAIELELGRASIALDDLALGQRRGGRSRLLVTLGSHRPGREETAAELVDIVALLEDSVEAWRAAASGREIRLELPAGFAAMVAGSRLRLAQASGNLIANAIEHGAGTIEVLVRQFGATVRIEVLDAGGGLPAPVAELTRDRRSFDPLARVGLPGRPPVAGSARGRGLRVVCAVAATHGGRVFSAPAERGARLVLELPLAPAPVLARRISQ